MGLADWIVDFFFSFFFFFLQDHVLYLIPSSPATSNFRTNLVLGMFGFPFLAIFASRFSSIPLYTISRRSSPISWHLESRRCCECLHCEFCPAECRQ